MFTFELMLLGKVNEFEFKSSDNIHFRTYALRKGMNSLIRLDMG